LSATHVFRLELEGGLRAGGERRPGVAVHSDTLRAALLLVSEETGVLRGGFPEGRPAFSVSSVFEEAEGVRLYPRPRPAPAPFASSDAAGPSGPWERIAWLTEDRLESLAEGRRVRLEPDDVIDGRAWGMPSERSLRLPNVRSGGRGRLFFLARTEDPALLAPLRELVARLGEAGLGRDRSRGAGQFQVAGVHAAPAFLGEGAAEGPPAAALLLSLYLPSRADVEAGVLDGAAVETLSRGGWIHSGGPTEHRKRPVRMLAEGGVLPRSARGARGDVVDVRPEGFDRHPVWRDGRPFLIPYAPGPEPSVMVA
jgi:CRISPR Csm4 C-terminal domain